MLQKIDIVKDATMKRIFGAEEFMDSGLKKEMEVRVEKAKEEHKNITYDEDDRGDESTNVKWEIQDVLECCVEFKLNGETCFQTCVKRKILSLERINKTLAT